MHRKAGQRAKHGGPNRKGGSKMEIMICNLIANLHGICAMVLKKSLEN